MVHKQTHLSWTFVTEEIAANTTPFFFFVVLGFVLCEVIGNYLCIVQEYHPATWFFKFWQFERFHGLPAKNKRLYVLYYYYFFLWFILVGRKLLFSKILFIMDRKKITWLGVLYLLFYQQFFFSNYRAPAKNKRLYVLYYYYYFFL